MINATALDIAAIVAADHHDPFSVLGPHPAADGGSVIRAFLPGADSVDVIDGDGAPLGAMRRVDDAGVYVCALDRPAPEHYRLRISRAGAVDEADDPYRFPAMLTAADARLLASGAHFESYRVLGAHVAAVGSVVGVRFAVWAPGARRVSVVGPFNDWDGRRHPMRNHPNCGVWDIFIPGLGEGDLYKYEIKAGDGRVLALKSDPYALRAERPPRTASIVHRLDGFDWTDGRWMAERAAVPHHRAPISIYEVHLGSWRRAEPGDRYLSYDELADELIPYVQGLGFTHIELTPVSEFPFDGSWGYQPVSLFAPTSRFGGPDDFRRFVDRCHGAGIGVLLDWVAGHFPEDEHGLAQFDGTHLYEHADPRRGRHMDWGTLIYNYGRNEVRNFLLSNALFWLDQFHIDGLRVDAVASMLYLDYSRADGEWVPNVRGGRENLDAVAFLRVLNELVYDRHPDVFTVAEESTAWPLVSRPTSAGGLGFGFKWNMGWMHDTLRYMARDPVHRRHHHDDLTFGLLYAFQENYVLPLSHDEVVHGKGSILARMPGDEWQRFANLRLYYTFMFSYPGKKLLFMGNEFAQVAEWSHDASLDWHLADQPLHKGVQSLVRDLNEVVRAIAALHERDCEGEGFAWIDCEDADNSTLAYLRKGADERDMVAVLCNFTPVPRPGVRFGVPIDGFWRERINSDSVDYGGSGQGNLGGVMAAAVPVGGYRHSITATLPPLAAVVLHRAAE